MNLNSIGFYTLTNERVHSLSFTSPISRAEILLTDRCNLKCPYCRGMVPELRGDMPRSLAFPFVRLLIGNHTKNIRFSGGEPTLYPHLDELIWWCKKAGMEHIAISTNGTAEIEYYKSLISVGVNDFSISLDAGCCAIGEKMTGGDTEAWDKASMAIAYLSQYTYVTVGVVFNELNYEFAKETLEYIETLNPSDIRIISSAQYNQALQFVSQLDQSMVNCFPILKYRVDNFKRGKPIRGISEHDARRCYLVLDDLAIAGEYHFPCIIYLREQGDPIGKMSNGFREERRKWFLTHNTHKDRICRENCLDVCVDHNNECSIYFPKIHAEEL